MRIFVLILCACMVIGCTKNVQPERHRVMSHPVQSVKYSIGVSQNSYDDWREKLNDEILREMIFHDDVKVEILSADDNSEKQIEDIRYFMDADFDIIIVSPREAVALTPIITAAYKKGIPVVLFDRKVNGENYTAYMGADNRRIGEVAGQYILSRLGRRGRIMEIKGLEDSTPADDRHEGMLAAISACEDMELVASAYADWTPEGANRVADSLLRLYPDVDAIFAHNDRMAIAARAVAKKHGLEHVFIVGVDAIPETGIKAVADGTIDATVVYPTGGGELVRTAMKILDGEPYNRLTVLSDAILVDCSNADILLEQDRLLEGEIEKISVLKAKTGNILARYSEQKLMLYIVVAVAVLLLVLIFMLQRAFRINKRSKHVLASQNEQLEKQRDQLMLLNDELEKQKGCALEMNEQLKNATNAKLAFFTNISHDLRTPLTLISAPVDMMCKADNLTEKQAALMRLAGKNVKILMRLVNQILDFRKYEDGKLHLNLTEVDLRKCVCGWADSFKVLALKRHIHFAVDIPEETDFSMTVDVEKMERVFFNLVSNAFKYTPENGTVTARFRTDGTVLNIEIADTGIGMSREDIGHIFDRFYQVEKVRPEGFGIGLALVKAFVELHGGTVAVESIPKQGTTFSVAIPVKHTSALVNESEKNIDEALVTDELGEVEMPEIDADEKRSCLLVIDDNRDIRTLIRGAVGDRMLVIESGDGQKGIKMAAKYIPDVIICDVMMPVMDGLECCRRLKSELTTSHIPVLMLTACVLDEQRLEGYKCGADAYLSKPFDMDMLLARIESLMFNRERVKQAFADKFVGMPQPEKATVQKGSVDNEFYARFVALVERDIADPTMSVETLGAELGLSRVQFYRKIKALTNYSPVELVRIFRLKRAASLLASSECTVAEISYKVGFSSPSYFAKCYKDYFGESPTDVQKRTSKL